MKMSRRQAADCGIALPNEPKRGRPMKGRPKDDHQGRNKLFDAACEAHGIPVPVSEYEFALPRKWRFDYAWGEFDLALEIQGGLFTNGRHVRGAALLKEHEKLNEAACRGWRVLFATPADVESGKVFEWLKRALEE